MNHVYKVPIIPQNLSKQETIVQIAEVLDHLSKVTDDIFKHINNKIDTSSSKLAGISKRIDVVNNKITKLSGAKKATQVFSSCKYPASEINVPYVSIFSDVTPPELIRHKVKHKKVVTSDEPIEKLHVYHVKVKSNESTDEINGLGEIPSDIEFVNDLLLYNTGKNIYKDFVILDGLATSNKPTNQQEINENFGIGAAPPSITERSKLTRSSTQSYFYSPNLGEVPDLDVPLDLPDLPNIADDFRYDIELGPGIAPSVTTTPNIPDLPIIESIAHDLPEVPESIPDIELPPPPPPPIPEPPPPAEEKPTEEQPETHIPKEDQENAQKLPQFEIPQLDMHASLMAAIRKAGGTKNLKTRTDTAKKETPKATAGGGDLMADLHAKLSMRRKGISGAKKIEAMDASSALEKISAMIPPPVKTQIELNENTEDEDWDD